MTSNVTNRSQGSAAVVAVAVVTFGFGLLFVTAAASRMPQTQSPPTSQASNSPIGGKLVVIGTGVKDKTIRFGDELVVLITLQNQGTKPIRIPSDALLLNNEEWRQGSGWGSGLGQFPLARAGAYGKAEFTLQPGESVSLSAGSVELAHLMGSMNGGFAIETKDEDLRRELGKPEQFTLSYYVAPSRLMTSAWAAKSAEDRKRLQPQIRELLLLASKPEESPGFYVLESLRLLGCHAFLLLESATQDSDPVIRAQAVRALLWAPAAAQALNSFVSRLREENEGRTWAASVERCEEKGDLVERESIKLAIATLSDEDARVRIEAIAVLTRRASYESSNRRSLANYQRTRESMDERTKQMYDSVGLVDAALPLVKKMAGDADPGVRAEAQKFLSNFTSQQGVAGEVVTSLKDPDAGVRSQALQALKSSHEPPPMATIEKAFASTRGEVALGLIELIYEREDSELSARLTPGFKERSAAERLMILTAIAGHTDEAALDLIGLGLKDGDAAVQRVALMRLLGFPTKKSIPLIKTNSAVVSPEMRQVTMAVQKELESRAMFPFLSRDDAATREITFPSIEGTGPMVSPDGKWVAYVETGWGRPGGSGGLGSSNMLSITHVARSDGTLDRVISDMFLVGWMSDSRRIASTRSGCATIVNLNGKTVVEFGEMLDKPYSGAGIGGETWPTGDMRHQFGVRMPHSKAFRSANDPNERIIFDYGEDSAFSPDGKWFGPRQVKDRWQFVDQEGNKREINAPDPATLWGSQASWSPDGVHVIVVPVVPSGSYERSTAVVPSKAFVIDVSGPTLTSVIEVDQVWGMGGWNYRKGRWNPWSRDGKRLALIRQGQVWTSDPDGNATQLTFDASNKIFPTFSPDGSKVAYITWQFDNRENYLRLGPTDIWVVDTRTGLAARITSANADRIEGLDWLDDRTLIYDRLQPDDRHSTLRTVSLR